VLLPTYFVVNPV